MFKIAYNKFASVIINYLELPYLHLLHLWQFISITIVDTTEKGN